MISFAASFRLLISAIKCSLQRRVSRRYHWTPVSYRFWLNSSETRAVYRKCLTFVRLSLQFEQRVISTFGVRPNELIDLDQLQAF